MINKTNASKYHTIITLLLRSNIYNAFMCLFDIKMNKLHYAFSK